jgi:hypothetical protein
MKLGLVDATTANGELEEAYQYLYKLEHRRADALAAISAASREIATSPDLQGTLRLVMDKAAQTLPMDAGVRPADISVNPAYQCEQGQNYNMLLSEIVLLATVSWSVLSIDSLLGLF